MSRCVMHRHLVPSPERAGKTPIAERKGWREAVELLARTLAQLRASTAKMGAAPRSVGRRSHEHMWAILFRQNYTS